MGEGHSLAELARLDNDALDILAVRHEQSRAANHDGGADVVGLNLTTLFERAEPPLTPVLQWILANPRKMVRPTPACEKQQARHAGG